MLLFVAFFTCLIFKTLGFRFWFYTFFFFKSGQKTCHVTYNNNNNININIKPPPNSTHPIPPPPNPLLNLPNFLPPPPPLSNLPNPNLPPARLLVPFVPLVVPGPPRDPLLGEEGAESAEGGAGGLQGGGG